MKRLLLALAIFSLPLPVNAQNANRAHSWLFSIGTGVANTDLNISQFQTYFHVKPVVGPVRNINASVKYVVTKKLAIGITAGFYHYSNYSEATRVTTPSLSPAANDYQVLYSSLDYLRHTAYTTVEGAYIYYNFKKGNIQLYATAGFGITHTTGYVDRRENRVYINQPAYGSCFFGSFSPTVDENKMTAYVAPIGIRGGKKIGWYAEAGYGYKGIFNAGLSYKL